MRKLASISLCLLLAIGVLAGAVPAAAAAGTDGPNAGGAVYQTEDSTTVIPASISGTVSPAKGPSGTMFTASVSGFWGDERVGVWWNAPDGTIIRSVDENTRPVDFRGQLNNVTWSTAGDMPGIWSIVIYGQSSRHQAVVFYEITTANTSIPPADAIPAPVSATIDTNVAQAGQLLKTTFYGFQGNEPVGYWFNTPGGVAQEACNQGVNWANDGVVDNVTGTSGMEPGLWSCVVQGIYSGHQAIVYFVITPSQAVIPIGDSAFPQPAPAHVTTGNGRGHELIV